MKYGATYGDRIFGYHFHITRDSFDRRMVSIQKYAMVLLEKESITSGAYFGSYFQLVVLAVGSCTDE